MCGLMNFLTCSILCISSARSFDLQLLLQISYGENISFLLCFAIIVDPACHLLPRASTGDNWTMVGRCDPHGGQLRARLANGFLNRV